MRAVVDTNVIAYFLLGTKPFVEEARQFWLAVTAALAPAIWEAELANVVWMAIRKGVVPEAEGPRRLEPAGRLGVHAVANRAGRALYAGHSVPAWAVYDTLFVELAHRERLSLATLDAKVLAAFPGIAKRPGDCLSK